VKAACEAGVHIALAGHFHRTYAEAASRMVERAGTALVIQAGTATSTRLRNDEPQSFNWLHVDSRERLALQVIAWDGASFTDGAETLFTFDGEGWHAAHASDAKRARTQARHLGAHPG
jgi:hypothetical protein